jgi:prefoldin subunit 5
MMEGSLRQKAERFRTLLGDLDTSIDAVEMLAERDCSCYDFELGNTMYGRAQLAGDGMAILCLGAGIFLEYEAEEALRFLQQKHKERQEEIEKVKHDLSFCQRQITTMEVNISRLYNSEITSKK